MSPFYAFFFCKKAKINFKTYGVTDWTTCNCNTCIVQYLKKSKQPDNEISSGKLHTKCGGKVSPRSFYKKSKLNISLDLRPEMLYKMAQNHTQNVVGKLVPDPLIKNQNWTYLLISGLKCHIQWRAETWRSVCVW